MVHGASSLRADENTHQKIGYYGKNYPLLNRVQTHKSSLFRTFGIQQLWHDDCHYLCKIPLADGAVPPDPLAERSGYQE